MGEYNRAVQGQSGLNYEQIPDVLPQPEYYSASSAYNVVPVKKKVKWTVPVCIAAGCLGLAGIGLLVYNNNKASITHMMKGDAGYAHSVIMGTVNAPEAAQTVNTFAAAAASSMSMISSEDGPESIQAGLSNSFSAMAAAMSQSAKVEGVSAVFGMSAELDGSFKSQLTEMAAEGGMDSAQLDEIIDAVTSLELYTAEKYSGGNIELAMQLREKSRNIGGIEIRYEKDGTITAVFPEISTNGLTIKLPEANLEELEKEIPQYDFTKLFNSVEKRTKKVFEEFDYEYKNGKQTVKGIEFDGVTVNMTLDPNDVLKLSEAVITAALDDEDFIAYIAEFSDSDKDSVKYDLKNALEDIQDEMNDGFDDEFKIGVQLYVSKDNVPQGFAFTFDSEDSDSRQEFYFVGNGTDMAAGATIDNVEFFRLVQNGTSETAGSGTVTFRTDTYDMNSIQSASMNYTYKNLEIKEVFGSPAIMGEIEFTLGSDLAEMILTRSEMGGELEDVLKNSKLTYTAVPNGKGQKVTVGLDVKGYGKLSFYSAFDEEKGNVAPKPDGYTLYDVENDMNEFGEVILVDLQSYVEKLCNDGSYFGQLIYSVMSLM